ncbi:MAG TPA: glutaredoxin family protein [Chloroflexi bacterium]|nr:glutaredoxin family protein [Chloroflexota bacterium]
MEAKGSIPGSHDEHRVMFYGLSTCGWCRRTRRLLEELDVAFDFVYVDLIQGEEREKALEQVGRWNPATSFPTLVIDEEQAVIGYRPDQIKEALGL